MTQRRVLVTGANRGIGQAVVQALSQRDDLTVLAAMRPDAQCDPAGLGEDVARVALDLSDPGRIDAQLADIVAAHGPVDILINNAAVLQAGDGFAIGAAELEHSLRVNAIAPHLMIRALARPMLDRGWGRIVNVSSAWGAFADGMAGPAAYSISKASLNAITLSWAQLLGPQVKINAVCPGWVRTDMGGAAAPRSPAEAADGIVWLASLPDDGPSGGFFRDRRLIEW